MPDLSSLLAEKIAERLIPAGPQGIAPMISDADPDAREIMDNPADEIVKEADGQTFTIQYKNDDGAITRRRISVQAVKRGGDGVLRLACKDHERNAPRTYRIDRILFAVDLDGEHHEPPGEFLADLLGLELDDVRDAGKAADVAWLAEQQRLLKLWNKSRDLVRPHAIILNALSQSDGVMQQIEIDVAVAYMGIVAPQLTSGEIDPIRVRRYIRSLRPDEKMLRKALAKLRASCTKDELTDLVISGKRLIEADGQLDAAEVDMLKQVSEELLGASII